MNIHVVRSVKGGSGKTCFALHKALELTVVELHPASGESTHGKDTSPDSGTKPDSNRVNQSPDQTDSGASGSREGGTPKSVAKVLYIDADVHASETMNMMVHKDTSAPEDKGKESYHITFDNDFTDFFKDDTGHHPHTLNSYMHPYRGYISTFKDIIMHGHVKYMPAGKNETLPDCDSLDFIFVDPTNRGRAVFENMYQSSGASAIGLGLYLAKMSTLLECASAAGYEEMVIDMPPGSDAFSSHLMELLTEFAGGKNGRKLHVYYVAFADVNHIRSSVKAAIEQHLHLMRTKTPYEVCFVYNAVETNDKGKGEGSFDAHFLSRKNAINYIKNHIGDDYINPVFELNRLNYYIMKRDKNYFVSVRSDSNSAVCFSYDCKEIISHIN